ncbi:MAG: phosphoglycerate kinase [Candidatus Pacebacteria bacterium]|jgi:phosphoglycerate kinase|nr:phosphoglycerate kinase [Candidatus Paceibacterota bacterium]
MMKSITEAGELRGKYVIVRSSCNVPLVDGKVGNMYRLMRALPTLSYLRDAGAKVIVIAHIGREETDSLQPVFVALQAHLPIIWGGKLGSEELGHARATMAEGDVLMVENLRQDPRESDNDSAFAAELASLADVYVNDAFDNIHRDHASMVALPRLLPAFAGITLLEEVSHIAQVMVPQHPSLFIIGGAKFETKMPLVEKYLASYDQVFVSGALANDIMLADGLEVGVSLVSDVSLKGEAFLTNPKLVRPVDVIVESARGVRVATVSDVQADEKITDMGPATVALLAPHIKTAKTILWNGPLGLYENGVPGSTQAVAKLIAGSDAVSVLGGGDTVAAVEELGLNDQFGFVSIGGGAMLTLLEAGNTPSLAALGYEG